jgi:hypothetical protein
MTEGVSVRSLITDFMIVSSIMFLFISYNLGAIFIASFEKFPRLPEDFK